jgi:hypothetical protein
MAPVLSKRIVFQTLRPQAGGIKLCSGFPGCPFPAPHKFAAKLALIQPFYLRARRWSDLELFLPQRVKAGQSWWVDGRVQRLILNTGAITELFSAWRAVKV